ncbi:STOREKEEPER protein-like [Cornus florida]|uniref:STOREKEEPER protein-like n=1 Tax=Cornus florida TaxID=4283 RepID=UPI0028A2AB72|nr:STOREKEEPER protein-like [Cornus florida]
MAPKRPSPLEDPPSASSSSEEKAQSEDIVDANHSESESDEEEVERNPNPTTIPHPHPKSSSKSETDEGSDSESDSDNTQSSPTAADFAIKPIASRPMDYDTKPKKESTLTPSAKRPAEAERNRKDSRSKRNKVSNGDEEDGAIEEKKSVNRLWSEDDEIAILKGMIDYKSKKESDPYTDMGAFHEFLKKSLHVDVTKVQLTDKIRRLKKKYLINAERGNNGEDPVFNKPHEHKSFELSKKIWGAGASNRVDDNAKSSQIKARKSEKVNNSVASPKKEELALQVALKPETGASQEDFWSMFPRLRESLQSEKGSYLSLSESGTNFVKERMSLIGSKKAKKLEEKWSNLRADEVELYLKQVELIAEQTKLVLAAMKSSKS